MMEIFRTQLRTLANNRYLNITWTAGLAFIKSL
ncbi:hypothetical protein DYBT9623_04239 [Dyadobacter sp. CECT 9623]|uniref:Uncharacterized protein n=1 Tax=Dyadobacter linearis TaxID=2823330 RepID=A0ABM8UV68_9BACT|nr:hypothetical protein DYBT9623_04239 [Dyadobacter sp. CECT 9623]